MLTAKELAEYKVFSFDDRISGPCIGIGHPKCRWKNEGYWELTMFELIQFMNNHHKDCSPYPDYSEAT